jgi:IS605 OrfB family transposase
VNHLLHLMTTDFVRRYWGGVNTIAIGDLTGIRDQIDYGSTLNQRLHAWPYGKNVKMIEYKAGLYGIEVVKVSEAYSSQTCHGCGECGNQPCSSGFLPVRLRMADTRRCERGRQPVPGGIQGISSRAATE